MAQSSTMYPFNITSNHDIHNSTSLLERRQQNASHLQLELPSLPPLSQLMTENNPKDIKVEQEAVTMAAMEAAVTASMITSTAQPLIQQNFLPTSNTSHITSTQQPLPISNPTLLYNPLDNTSFMPEQQLSVAGLTDHGLMTMPPSFIDTRHTRESSVSSNSSDSKVYSFVAIPGTNQRKRPRRRYDEIERLYHCNWAGCTKAYGTLNHLNAHVSMQQHGAKRHPTEFKEMRKEWRRQKKERDTQKKQAEAVYRQQQQQQQQHHQQMMTTFPQFHPNQIMSNNYPLNFY